MITNELRELIRPLVKNLHKKYMFISKSLSGVVDRQMIYVKKIFERHPDRKSGKRGVIDVEWCRQLPHSPKYGLNHLEQTAARSPNCQLIKKLLKERGGREIKEEVDIPIRSCRLGLWRDKLRKYGINETNINSGINRESWFKNFISVDIIDVKTGLLIEADGRSFHKAPIDSARDEFLKDAFGLTVLRVTGFKSPDESKIDKDYNKLIQYLDSLSSDIERKTISTILSENIEAAIDFFISENDRQNTSLIVFQNIITALNNYSADWKNKGVITITDRCFDTIIDKSKLQIPIDKTYLKNEISALFKDIFHVILEIKSP